MNALKFDYAGVLRFFLLLLCHLALCFVLLFLRNVDRVLSHGLGGKAGAAKSDENGAAHFSESGSDI